MENKEPAKKQENKEIQGKKEKSYKVTFRENRKFDLHVNRKVITFRGREKKELSNSDIISDRFKQVANMFIVERSK